MEKCLFDLLESKKDCVRRINRSEDRIALLKSEIDHIKQACSLDEWMDRDVAALERQIAQEENDEVANKVCLSNIRREISEHLVEVLKWRLI